MSDDRSQGRSYEALLRKVGPAGVRFVEFVSGEYWARARAAALESGFTAPEAEAIARDAAAGAVKGLVSGMTLQRKYRALHMRN